MAFPLGTQFLLFLWFSGVNHLVNPSSEAVGSGMEPDYQQQDMLPMENQQFHLPPQHYRLAFPPYHADPIQEPSRRQYRLEDFLWNGSGDGPHPSEQDGGLAWEDNGGGTGLDGGDPHSRSWIKVTKTMTLYRTVLTTIYPIEMTPTVISGLPIPIQPTPNLSDYPLSSSIAESDTVVATDNMMWLPTPTPTFTPSPPEPTQTASFEDNAATNDVQPTKDNFSAESTNIVYWIQTSIKANDTAFKDTPRVFQTAMQKSLARVYASAFKRHLLSTLGVLPATNPNNSRRRRSSDQDDSGDSEYLPDQLVHRWLYVAQSSMSPTQLKHLATTAMNVTVSIVNVSAEKVPKLPRVDLRYVVLAEGSPVPAFSAVKELDRITKEEMEKEIGYEIIDKKAEALVPGPEQMTRNEQIVATSPWLIVAVTTICLLVILLVLIAFMVWKWKHNRLGDSNSRRVPPAPRPQSGIIEIEEGVINPAFLGTPSRIGRDDGSLESTPKSSPAISLLSARARLAKKKLSEVLSRHNSRLGKGRGDEEEGKGKSKRKQKGIESSPTSSEELRLHKKSAQITSSEGSAEWKELLGEPKAKLPARVRQRSPVRAKTAGAKPDRRETKDMLRRRRRKTHISKLEDATLKTDEDDESELSQTSGEVDHRGGSPKPGTSEQPAWSRGSTDAISLGNLDICQDSIAQTPSEYARKLVPWKRPGSAAAVTGSKSHYYMQPGESSGRRPGSRVALPETIEEIPSYDLTEEEDAKELDRDLSEKSFDMKDSPRRFRGGKAGSRSPLTTPDTKDAQVQTPTRISKTTSHKARAAPKPKRSWRGSPSRAGPSESVISTESEEIVEVHHINSSMSDDQNPLGRMRKRFHQFLDDAFNVMGNKREDEGNPRSTARGETQSAKVSISHEVVETETEWRPWTSHIVREETLQKLRQPKAAAVPIGPPKRAWTASSERKTPSAKSKPPSSEQKSTGSTATSRVDIHGGLDGAGDNTISERSQSHSSMALSPAFIFPQYPAYPDIRVGTESGRPSTASSSQSQQGSSQPPAPPTLPSNDPAVPVIQAIKNEMKRLEKDSSTPSSSKQS